MPFVPVAPLSHPFHKPSRLGGPHPGEVAALFMRSWGTPQIGGGNQSGDITPAVLGACPYHLGEPPKGDGNQSGYITLTVLGAPMWATWVHNPCRLGGPHPVRVKWLQRGAFLALLASAQVKSASLVLKEMLGKLA